MSGNKTEQENTNLIPRSVVSFKNYHFYIPGYQRGYRWSRIEVKKLLEDLANYYLNETDEVPYYCMQPLVVLSKENDEFEVLDGQQRLTTLFLILRALNKDVYKLTYQTRAECENYVNNIGKNPEQDNRDKDLNIDNYHIYNAYKVICDFIDPENNPKVRASFERNILNLEESDKNPDIKFIWYDISSEIRVHNNEIGRKEKIFSRLNVGKISLTPAELLKASLVNRVNAELKYHPSLLGFDKKYQELLKNDLGYPLKLKIATEWDMVEHTFHDPDFWAFIYGPEETYYETRIEYIFDNLLMAKKNTDDRLYTFEYFQKELKKFDELMKNELDEDDPDTYYNALTLEKIEKCRVESVWHEVMDTFYTYRNWYSDRNLYHLIGLLRYFGMSLIDIESIRKDEKTRNKDIFIKRLREEVLNYSIREQVEENEYEDIDIESLSYSSIDKGKILNILVLFNVFSILNCEQSDTFFSFKNLYNQKYDIEHIRSQNPKNAIKNKNDRNDWIITNLEYFSGELSGIHTIPEGRDYKKSKKEKINEYLSLFTDNKLSKMTDIISYEIIDNQNRRMIETLTVGEICRQLKNLYGKTGDITNEPIFTLLYKNIFKQTDFDEEDVDKISNLALLDSSTNRGYQNAFFPVKRHWIIEREKNGYYIPPCTKNVFMKTYSKKLSDLMNWTKEDADSYLE